MLVNGWLDWAIKLPRTDGAIRTYRGTNQVKGIFFHSAEGYKDTLLNLALHGPLSWQFSNMIDGEFYQHYPITARCWHASAANFDYIGCENEGVGDETLNPIPEPTLSPPQIDNAVHMIKDVSTFKGWVPSRPFTPTDKTNTLWEHTEVIKLGGTGTACPSHRIPWDTILERLETMPTDQEQVNALNELAYWILRGWNLDDMADFMQAAIKAAYERMVQAQHD